MPARKLLLSLLLCGGLTFTTAPTFAQDVSNELKKLTTLAEAGDVVAQTKLGLAYDLGNTGATQNKTEAVRWYRKAAEHGYPAAQYYLGLMNDLGEGVPENDTEAARWYRKAAEQGNMNAQYNLGVKYERGQGVAQNYQDAGRWYRKSAEQGYALAQANLGLIHGFGKGVPVNKVRGYLWLSLAAAAQGQDNGNANGRLRYLAEDMTSEQIAEAQNLAANCLANDYKNCD